MARSSFGKRERDQAKKAKAKAKLERRRQVTSGPDDEAAPPVAAPEADADAILAELAVLHERFEAGTIPYDDFDAAKADLLARLPVE